MIVGRSRLTFAIETVLLAQFVGLHHIEEFVAFNDGLIQVDDYVTIDDTAFTAATVDVAAKQTAGKVVVTAVTCITRSHGIHLGVGLGLYIITTTVNGVPDEFCTSIVPTFGLDFQTREVQHQLVACVIGILSDETALISGVKAFDFFHNGRVTATHQLVENDNFMREVYGLCAGTGHATHVTATVERAYLRTIRFIVGIITSFSIVEHHAGHQIQGTTSHVLGKQCLSISIFRLIGQI